jgi:hypothetical protein
MSIEGGRAGISKKSKKDNKNKAFYPRQNYQIFITPPDFLKEMNPETKKDILFRALF